MTIGPETTRQDGKCLWNFRKKRDCHGTIHIARQDKNKDSMMWSCQLGEIYRKAVTKVEVYKKMKSKYWNGLPHQWFKN